MEEERRENDGESFAAITIARWGNNPPRPYALMLLHRCQPPRTAGLAYAERYAFALFRFNSWAAHARVPYARRRFTATQRESTGKIVTWLPPYVYNNRV